MYTYLTSRLDQVETRCPSSSLTATRSQCWRTAPVTLPRRALRIEVPLDQALQLPRVQGAPSPGNCFARPPGGPLGPLPDIKLLGRRRRFFSIRYCTQIVQRICEACINLDLGQILLDRVTKRDVRVLRDGFLRRDSSCRGLILATSSHARSL